MIAMHFPPVTRHLLRLRLTGPARFAHFLHGGVVHGLLGRALRRHRLPAGLVPAAPESGRVAYEPGDAYHLGLTLVGEARGKLPDVERDLREIGAGVTAATGPLGGNFEVEAVDALKPIDVEAEASELASGGGDCRLRFVSPLRLQRPAGLTGGGSYLDRCCFPLPHFLDRLWRRLFFLARGAWPAEEVRAAAMPPPPEGAEVGADALLWIDLPHRERQRTLGGVVGAVECRGVPEDWLPILAAGRHLHAGASTHFGFGRYVLGDSFGRLETPARRLIEELAERERLERALDHVADQSVAAGVDGVSPARFRAERATRIPALAAAVGRGEAPAAPLLGLAARRDDRRALRPLAIPTVGDRVLQRAAAELLAGAVDTLFEDCSFAYRKGYSRAGAARAIQRAYRDGFRVVLDADISAFFDEVRWDRLFAMLEALFPGEPLLGPVRLWVTAPVHFEGLRLRRRRGLPQGSPISPLLANLYLDELDDEVLGEDFRLVRYADDFVVLCRDVETAQRARDTVEAVLADLGLELNEEKTAVRSLDDGVSYLGYLFCRSLVLEPLRDDQGDAPALVPADLEIPARSWLARVPLDRVRAVLDERAAGRGRRRVEAVPIGRERGSRRPLYVVSPQARVFLRGGRLVVDSGEEEDVVVPVRNLSHVVVVGRSRITVPLLLSLDEVGVPVYFCRRSGELRACWQPHEPEWPVWQAQAHRLDDDASTVAFAREIVNAKLANHAVLLIRHRFAGGREAAARIRGLAAEAASAGTVEVLRGFEGAAAKAYFESVREELGEAWGFEGRRHRPPPDPVNALLSFVYTLLHHHCGTALVSAGLNPRLGLYHRPRGSHHALASDLQEELRFLAEGTVWALLRRREIKPEDFRHRPDSPYPYLLRPEPRRKVIAAFEKRLLTEIELTGEERRPWREVIDRQAWRLRCFVLDPESAPYEAIRVRR